MNVAHKSLSDSLPQSFVIFGLSPDDILLGFTAK